MKLKKKLKKIGECVYEIPKEGDMKVPARFFMSEKLLNDLEEGALKQAVNVTTLPGLYKYGVTCPDAHYGYGFPIGGVAAIDFEKGCISPGGIGFDINCGVRLLSTPLTVEEVEPKIKQLLDSMFKNIPCGVGRGSDIKLSNEELDNVLNNGAQWALEQGYGVKDDVEHCEENGRIEHADASCVSAKAKKRGRDQLGTLGAGNHFLEIQVVDKIFDIETAKKFGIEKEGQATVMIHCGSRGLGHQVCSDYLREMERADPELMKSLPEKDLIYAKAGSDLANRYFKAMCAAANYAWANRHIIAHQVKKSFKEVFGTEDLKTIYDVAHNIAKIEEHEIDGKKVKVYLHRKGATRSFPAGHPDVPKAYRDVGQPVIIPGSMGTASYLLVGTQKALEQSFGSTAHGAGRVMSRMAAKKKFRGEQVKQDLEKQKIYVKSASWKGVCEEAPGVYKDIDEVVKASHDAGIGNLVVRVRPLGVIKG